ncbi:MAG: protein translocase subunit SecF [Dehalococcoidales bacterium]|nr:protein translocase subunit SecF [Dehalococcoidales bacterium]
MFNIVSKRFWFFLASGIVILAGIISMTTFGRLKAGIEFSSGSIMTVNFEQEVTKTRLEEELAGLGYTNVIIQRAGENDWLIRLPELTAQAKSELGTGLTAALGHFEIREFDSVSPMIATETVRTAGIAVAIATIGILLYVTWVFRRMPHPFRYGTCAIIALIHDALVAITVFSILSGVMGWEVNLMFVIGILTVIGYSINDTVVIFDRIRENLTIDIKADFETIVNNSLVETLPRSLNTSLTTAFVVLALILFVGASIQNFAVPLLTGIITGTYSSIGIASPLLVVWQKGEWRRFIPGA